MSWADMMILAALALLLGLAVFSIVHRRRAARAAGCAGCPCAQGCAARSAPPRGGKADCKTDGKPGGECPRRDEAKKP